MGAAEAPGAFAERHIGHHSDGAQRPRSEAFLDSLVDGFAQSEVVSGDDASAFLREQLGTMVISGYAGFKLTLSESNVLRFQL